MNNCWAKGHSPMSLKRVRHCRRFVGEPQMLPVDFTPRRSNNVNAIVNAGNNANDGASNNNNNSFSSIHFKDMTDQAVNSHLLDSSDGLSYDASEMSEMANPAYASSSQMSNANISKPDPEEEDGSADEDDEVPADTEAEGTHHKRGASAGSSLQEQSESAVPLLADDEDVEEEDDDESSVDASVEGAEASAADSGKENVSALSPRLSRVVGVKLPPSYTVSPEKPQQEKRQVVKFEADLPLARMESEMSEDDDRDDKEVQQVQQQHLHVAKSCILSKYAKNGRARRSQQKEKSSSLGAIHDTPVRNKGVPSSNSSVKSSSSLRSIGSPLMTKNANTGGSSAKSVGSVKSFGSVSLKSPGTLGSRQSQQHMRSAEPTPIRKGAASKTTSTSAPSPVRSSTLRSGRTLPQPQHQTVQMILEKQAQIAASKAEKQAKSAASKAEKQAKIATSKAEKQARIASAKAEKQAQIAAATAAANAAAAQGSMAKISSATSSALLLRRQRMSPTRNNSTAVGGINPTRSVESTSRSLPRRAVGRKPRASPSVVDNLAYYSSIKAPDAHADK